MIKKVIKTVSIIILTILIVIFSKGNSYALTRDDRPTLKKGDKFKIVSNSYEYKDYGVAWTKNYKENKDGIKLKKGDIVEWTGEEDSDASAFGSTKFFYKVKKGKDTFWMIQENLEKYKVQVADRPSTINDFIRKYNISSTMTDSEFNKKYNEYLKKAKSENTYNENLISSDKTHVNEFIDAQGEKAEDIKNNIVKLYKDYCNPKSTYYIMQTETDYRFITEAYYLSYKYLKAEIISNEYSDSNSSVENFDKAVKKYKSANSAAEKDAAFKVIEDEWKNLSDDEKKDRQDEYDNIFKTEGERTKKNQEDREDTSTESSSIYQYPTKEDGTSAGSLDDMIGDADKFLNSSAEPAIKSSALQSFSNKFYNIFLTVGIIVAVIIGMVLGIKFMVGGTEEKANIKEVLVPYVVGCIVIFGAFAIWKLVVTILSNSFL